MKVALEKELWDRILRGAEESPRKRPRQVIAEMKAEGKIASEKQAWRTLEKWPGNVYEYGVTLDLGWIQPGSVFPRLRELESQKAPTPS